MSLIILKLRHYNTPGTRKSEGIVQSSSNTGYKSDRLPDHKYHHRNRHRFSNPAEPAPCDRLRLHPDRRRDEHWPWWCQGLLAWSSLGNNSEGYLGRGTQTSPPVPLSLFEKTIPVKETIL
ncbi:hypothetical protein LCGC14_0539940 [marine sediment metagenome]|uniref:Uncharacterized protein n=1 Tax=marine sediment metagenome TaxID=412755 RepID=A0A0F9SBK2_9ZZZZ